MKPSLLLIEPYAYIPTDSGGKNRTLHTVEELSKQYEIELITILARRKSWFSFLTHGVPYWFSDWSKPILVEQLKQLNSKTHPNILVEYTQLLHLIDYLPKASTRVFTAYDISTVSFWRRLREETNIIKRIIGFFRWIEVYLYEKKYLHQYDKVITVSDHDAKLLKQHFGVKQVEVIENGIDGIFDLPERKYDGYINLGYIGSFSHPPNLHAVQFFLNHIVPELEKQKILYRLIIAGNDSLNTQNSNVTLLGYVQDKTNFYGRIDMLIAPIFSGSGSRIKIIESLSCGKPVVTTEVGSEGVDIKSNYLRIVSAEKNALAWVKEIMSLVENDKPNLSQKKQLNTDLIKLTWEKLFSAKRLF